MSEVQPLFKPKTFKSARARAEYRSKHYCCEICGGRMGLQIHHLKTRGAGGGDEPSNLIVLDMKCHKRIHEDADFRRRVINVL